MTFLRTIEIPRGTDEAKLSLEIVQLLRGLNFSIQTIGRDEIKAVKTSPLGVRKYVLSVIFSGGEVQLKASSHARGFFLALLPVTGCSLLCSLTCGLACSTACSCGASFAVLGKAVEGLGAYSHHLFELIAAVITEKVRHAGMCPRCGTAVPASARFCRNCGAPVNEA